MFHVVKPFRTLNRALAFVACLGVAGGCGAPEDVELSGRVTRAITDGEIDEEHTGIVALTYGGFPFCSGTVISPTVVLTAAHCLPPHAESVDDMQDIVIAYATNVIGPSLKTTVEEGWTHPDFGSSGLDYDIGLLRLSEPAPVTPIPPALETVEEGDHVLVVGYGVTATQGRDSGIRRSGLALVDWVSLRSIRLLPEPSNICFGDSGGGSLAVQDGEVRVVGIHSRLGGQECGPAGVDERVDVNADHIRAFVLGTGPTCARYDGCVRDCALPDLDCECGGDGVCSGVCPDGQPDPDCAEICEADGICSEACGTTDPDCPCSEDGRCEEGCPDDPDCLEPTEPCSHDGFCDETCDEDLDCLVSVSSGSGGCSVGGAQPGAPFAAAGFSLLVALMLSRLRRR